MMRQMSQLLGLPWRDRWLLVRTSVLLACVRIALYFVPLLILHRQLLHAAAILQPRRTVPLDRILWSVRQSNRFVPNSTCLAEALTLETMLIRHRYPARLVIGVGRGDDGQIQAHAWVESQGKPLADEPNELSRFVRFSHID